MPSSQEILLSLVPEALAHAEPQTDLDTLRSRLAAAEERVSGIERELSTIDEQERELARQLDTRRTRLGSLHRELHEAGEAAVDLMRQEAAQTRDAMIAEASGLLETARADAEREATAITSQAFDQAETIVADAKRESEAIVAAGQERLVALEAEAIQRAADLDAEHRELSNRLEVMRTLYNELQATLIQVAEASVQELALTKDSLAQLEADEDADAAQEVEESIDPAASDPVGDQPTTNADVATAPVQLMVVPEPDGEPQRRVGDIEIPSLDESD